MNTPSPPPSIDSMPTNKLTFVFWTHKMLLESKRVHRPQWRESSYNLCSLLLQANVVKQIVHVAIRLSFYLSEFPYQYGRFLFQGVIPLGGCMVEESMSGSQKFAIRITNQNFKVRPQYL